jgi:hypothetical protein
LHTTKAIDEDNACLIVIAEKVDEVSNLLVESVTANIAPGRALTSQARQVIHRCHSDSWPVEHNTNVPVESLEVEKHLLSWALDWRNLGKVLICLHLGLSVNGSIINLDTNVCRIELLLLRENQRV